MKSIKIICSSKASPQKAWVFILLVVAILLWQGSDSWFQNEASADDAMTKEMYIEEGQRIIFGSSPETAGIEPIDDEVVTVEEYVEMGRILVFGSVPVSGPQKTCNQHSGPVTPKEFAEFGRVLVFGSDPFGPLPPGVGRGRCPLCHTFEPGDNIGRCLNLFGIEERSHVRIKEERYLNEPISIGEMDHASGIVKGAPNQIPEKYRREGSLEMTGEDYLRESLLCPSCYVVEGFGKEGDVKSTMWLTRLSKVKLNAVIAWLQAKDTPGDYSRVTVPLPKRREIR